MKESKEWKDVPNTNGKYKASRCGYIYDVENKKYVKKYVNECGYQTVYLIKRTEPVHRIIATTFFGESDSNMVVNHKNSIRCDNRVENLEWCTQKENMHHAKTKGRIPASKIKTPSTVEGKCILLIELFFELAGVNKDTLFYFSNMRRSFTDRNQTYLNY